MYHKIVLAVDGSDASNRALDEALDIAALAQGRLHAVYIVNPWRVSPYSGYYDPEALRKVLREDGQITLEAARKVMAERGVAGDTEIEETKSPEDDIPSCLHRFVQRHDADLVVMGTHGRHGVGRAVLGSVAEQFLRMATCPVILVRSCATDLQQTRTTEGENRASQAGR
ncbi:universal stress protein [Burkholderia sp. 4M9327F10]|uniref:universal stress protein n=1 Tax=Burkholderia sp. 4M9327F10 TaxID=2502223 RepID=UPI0010F66219|nr:universal stress protein [Burkholderia sp. 4M9327F10]